MLTKRHDEMMKRIEDNIKKMSVPIPSALGNESNMIKRDTALEHDKCSICDRVMPPGATILRKVENNNIICILCLVEIAEIAQHERPATQP